VFSFPDAAADANTTTPSSSDDTHPCAAATACAAPALQAALELTVIPITNSTRNATAAAAATAAPYGYCGEEEEASVVLGTAATGAYARCAACVRERAPVQLANCES
jgi:hypothetical protein